MKAEFVVALGSDLNGGAVEGGGGDVCEGAGVEVPAVGAEKAGAAEKVARGERFDAERAVGGYVDFEGHLAGIDHVAIGMVIALAPDVGALGEVGLVRAAFQLSGEAIEEVTQVGRM